MSSRINPGGAAAIHLGENADRKMFSRCAPPIWAS